jgi:glycosyltransferase involved in cell wall biosynthesis
VKLSVIIPAYNEERLIASLLDKVIEAKLPDGVDKEILVINDGSTDGTVGAVNKYVKESSVLLFHQENAGKTAAILKGVNESSGDIILIQDADLEYDPAQYAQLLDPILQGKSSIVYGSRFMGTIENMQFPNRLANIMTNLTLNMIYGTKLTDNNTCYKVFKKNILDGITITSSHFGFDCEVTVKWLKRGIPIHEVPIRYVGRTKAEGKKVNFVNTFFGSYLLIFKYALRD